MKCRSCFKDTTVQLLDDIPIVQLCDLCLDWTHDRRDPFVWQFLDGVEVAVLLDTEPALLRDAPCRPSSRDPDPRWLAQGWVRNAIGVIRDLGQAGRAEVHAVKELVRCARYDAALREAVITLLAADPKFAEIGLIHLAQVHVPQGET